MTDRGSASRGLRVILLATVVAGAAGYAVQLAASALLDDPGTYVAFTVLWSTVYLAVTALSGLQQEITRASRPVTAEREPQILLRRFTLGATAVVLFAAAAVAAVLTGNPIRLGYLELAGVLAVAFVGYVLTAVLSGVLYGLRAWGPIGLLTVLDALLRAGLLLAGFLLDVPLLPLAIFVALPFGLAFAITWLLFRRAVAGAFRLDVGLGVLSRHAASAAAAAAASGVLITGLPLLVGVTSPGEGDDAVGALLTTIMLTRAPIVVPIIALQSFLIASVFRDGSVSRARALRLGAVAAAVGALLCVAGWALGPAAISLLSQGRYDISASTAVIVIASACLVAAMCVTGPALISRRRHTGNVIGWAVAAALTVVCLLLPLGFELRLSITLLAPPVVGLAVHLVALRRPTEPAGPGRPDPLR